MTSLALTASEVGDLYWLIGWCVLFVCAAAVLIVLLRELGKSDRL